MADAPEYVLIPLASREDTLPSSDPDVRRFPTLRRDSWEGRVRVTQVGTSVEVEIQATPYGDDDADYVTVYSNTYAATADETITAGGSLPWSTEPDLTHAYLRAIVPSADGEYVVEVTAKAPVFDEDTASGASQAGGQDLLSDDLQAFDDKDVVVQRAQDAILQKVLGQDARGRFTEIEDWRLTRPNSLTLVKQAIALQAEHEFVRYRALRSDTPSDAFLASGSRYPGIAPGVVELLDPIVQVTDDLVWRHR